MSCIPRPVPRIIIKREFIKTPWNFFNSIFKEYRADNPELLNECFEFDWDSSKLDKIIKNEDDKA